MKIVIGECFWIPQLERDVFGNLVKKAGLHYDKSHGFKVTSETDLDLMKNILEIALKEEIEVVLKCFICGDTVECIECVYQNNCESSKVFYSCVCKTCDVKDEVSNLYAIRFLELVG